MFKIGPLYAKSSTGKIKQWTAIVTDDANIIIEHGYIDGKLSTSTKQIFGKNLGKSNETSPYNQAVLEARSKMNKKIDEGYCINLNELKAKELFLPMLALSYKDRKHDISWPAYVQPKLDGVRCLTQITENGQEYVSRKGKLFTTLSHLDKDVKKLICDINCSLDGEIFHPEWNFQEITRAVKKYREDITEHLQYWVYDIVDVDLTFEKRYEKLEEAFGSKLKVIKSIGNIILVPSEIVNSEEEMIECHKRFTQQGFEGTIIRNRDGKYILKNRSKDLQKYKDFEDDEFKIIGGFEATGNDIGTVIFQCETKNGKLFTVRPKGSRETRKEWMRNIDKLIGKELTIRFQGFSEDGVPRFPVGICLRDYE